MKILDVRLILIVITLLMFVACGGSGNRNSTISKINEALSNNNSSSAVNGPVRGNKTSKIYHWQGCPEYDRIAKEHVVEFPNAAAAEAAGYRAALNCPKESGNGSSAKTQAAPPSAQPANKSSNSNKNVNTTSDATEGHARVKVWVNTDSGIYECPGSALYGKTKKGEYMTQAAAQKKGLRPAGNKMCQ